jgi:hypothetical protein
VLAYNRGPRISPLAGHLPLIEQIVDVAKLIDAYNGLQPDPSVAAQRVAFGTSGHRGSQRSRRKTATPLPSFVRQAQLDVRCEDLIIREQSVRDESRRRSPVEFALDFRIASRRQAPLGRYRG